MILFRANYVLVILYLLCHLCQGFSIGEINELLNVSEHATDFEYCHAKDLNPYRLYASKSSYDSVRNHSYPLKKYKIKECTPQYLYFFGRHATRYPDAEDIKVMQEILPNFRDQILSKAFTSLMCFEDLQTLNNWKLQFNINDDNRISSSGETEANSIAKRYKTYFKSILKKKFSSDLFTFSVTSRNRTTATALSFFGGLFGKKALSDLNLIERDDILQFHKLCQTYRGKKNKTNSQAKLFQKSADVERLIQEVSRKIQLSASFDDITLMYRTCEFEYSILGYSPWCAIFNTEHLKILEYYEDLDDMENDGYLDPINAKQTCPLFNHLLTQLDRQTKKPDRLADFHFSHAGALKKLITALRLFKDSERYDATSTSSEYNNRKWRTSFIAPFSGNLGFLLSNCDGGSSPKVTVFLNEEPIVIPGCGDKNCDYNTFVSLFSDLVKDCDLKKICSAPL